MKKQSSSSSNELIPFMINVKILPKKKKKPAPRGFCHACYGNNHIDKSTWRVTVIKNAILGRLKRAELDGLWTMNTHIKKKHEQGKYVVVFGSISSQSVGNLCSFICGR